MNLFKKSSLLLILISLYQSINAQPMCMDVYDNLDPTIQSKLQNTITKNNADLNSIMKSGLEQKDSSIGCYFGGVESYQAFRPLVNGIVERHHEHNPQEEYVKDFDISSIQDTNLDPEGKYIISTRIRVARSLKDFPFTSTISKEERKTLETNVVNVLNGLEGNLKGTYYPLYEMSEERKAELVAKHMLFKSSDRFLESAGIMRDMPDARGIFFSPDEEFIVWVNEEDHLRIMSLQQGADVIAVFNRMSSALEILDQKLEFAFDKNFGYLNSCVTNIGTAMRASVHIRLPKISQREDFKELCKSMGLAIRGVHGEHSESSEGIYDISNAKRLGKSTKDTMIEFVTGVKKLIELEKNAS